MHSTRTPLSAHPTEAGTSGREQSRETSYATRDPTRGPVEYRQLSSIFPVFQQDEPCPRPPKSQKDVYEDSVPRLPGTGLLSAPSMNGQQEAKGFLLL